MQTSGVITVAQARAMVQKLEENQGTKAEAVLKTTQREREKPYQKAANETAKRAREWRNKGALGLLYIVDREGGGRFLKRA